MNQYDLSADEDLRLLLSIKLHGRKYLYEYFCDLPLEVLQAYPKKGYRGWMGRVARIPDALSLRDYILHWRLFALDFRKKYPREYLETLSEEEMQVFLNTYIQKTPLWAYADPIKDVLQRLNSMDTLT